MRKITDQPGYFELFEREYKVRGADLGWENASPIERLMIERILLLWVRLLWCERYNAGYMKGGAVSSVPGLTRYWISRNIRTTRGKG